MLVRNRRRTLLLSAFALASFAVPEKARADVEILTGWATSMTFQCVDLIGSCSVAPGPPTFRQGNILTLTNGGGSMTFQFLGHSGTLIATNAEVQQIFLGTLVTTVTGPFTGFPDVGNFPLFSVDLNLRDEATERGGTVFHGGVYLTHDATGNAYLSFTQPIWTVSLGDRETLNTFLQYPPNDLIPPTNGRVDLFGYEVIHFMPEPSTISLTLSGLVFIGGAAIRRRQRATAA